MSLRVAGKPAEEVVARRRRRGICIRAADLVGAEVARSSRPCVVARGAGGGVAERDEQRQCFESGHGFAPTRPFRWLLLVERGADSNAIELILTLGLYGHLCDAVHSIQSI